MVEDDDRAQVSDDFVFEDMTRSANTGSSKDYEISRDRHHHLANTTDAFVCVAFEAKIYEPACLIYGQGSPFWSNFALDGHWGLIEMTGRGDREQR